MPDAPDDRTPPKPADAGEPPRLYVVVKGVKFPRPGLETYFAQSGGGPEPARRDPVCSCNPVVGVYCSCNKVCTCVPVCGCAGHRSCGCVGHTSCGCVGHTCSCVGHSSGRSYGGGGCRCAPVH